MDCKVISGIFQIQYRAKNEESRDADSDEENDPWLDFDGMGDSDTSVRSRVLKDKEVSIKDDHGKVHCCQGKFPLTQIFWKVTVKVNKGWVKSAPAYTIRNDDNVQKHKLVNIFLTECLEKCILSECLEKCILSDAVRACFEAFCRVTHIENTLSFVNLEDTLKRYITMEHQQGCHLKHLGGMYSQFQQEDHSEFIENAKVESDLFTVVLRAASHPNLVETLSILLPYTFIQFLHKLELKKDQDNGKALELADKMSKETPWEFVFRDIIYAKLGLQGTEATLLAYRNAGYLLKTPQIVKDAIFIYEVLKLDAKQHGHTYMTSIRLRNARHFKKLQYQINGEKRWREALVYLEKNKVIKREYFNVKMNIFLYHNWKAEVDIVNGLKVILEKHKKEPLSWIIDYTSPDFDRIFSDDDQKKALHVIASSPIAILSGKGGCGKTTVITTLLKHVCEQMERTVTETREGELELQDKIEGAVSQSKTNYVKSHNADDACEDNSQYFCQSRNTDADMQGSWKSLDASISQNPTDSASYFLSNGADGSAKNIVEVERNSTACCSLNLAINTIALKSDVSTPNSTHPTKQAQEISSSLDKSDLISSSNCQTPTNPTKSERKWPQASKPEPSKKEIFQRETISDLIKIVTLARDVDHHLLQVYKERILLTAPTGKAAKLLGSKANLPSATLHSVIMSWRSCSTHKNKSWGYSAVQVLVVDECSLLSVGLFACAMNILLKHAKLRKVILLGDMRQLPSIEPGNFLTDVFKAIGSVANGNFNPSVELTSNHRSESCLIVENAGKISNQKMPTFNKEMKFHLVELSDEADDNERDEAIRKLLNHADDVKSHVNSQFVCFRKAHCEAINELCCRHYNEHTIKTSTGGKKEHPDFCIGDKICLGKNALVTNFRELLLQTYCALDADLQEAIKETMLKHNKINLDQTEQTTSIEVNLNQTRIDADLAQSLCESDDAVSDQTVNEMIKRDHQIKELKTETAKQRQKLTTGQEALNESSRRTEASLLGEEKEKLCNGEVFFIMDEIQVYDETSRQSMRYLVLSDKDPICPRVLCVPLKVLRKDCRMKHSWARTIHTFQGSESDSVIYYVGKAKPQNWQHVYTAVTRGKKSVYIIGSWQQLFQAISREEPERYSRLKHRLREMIVTYKDMLLENFNKYFENVTSITNRDDVNSGTHKVDIEEPFGDSYTDEDLAEIYNSVKMTEGDDCLNVIEGQAQTLCKDGFNDLNQHSCRKNDLTVYNNLEEIEFTNSDEELTLLPTNTPNFTSLTGPDTTNKSLINLSPENNCSGTLLADIINASSPIRSIAISEFSPNRTSLDVLSTPKGACPLSDSVSLSTPYKVRRTDSPFNTPFQNKFAHSLKLEETNNEEKSVSHKKRKLNFSHTVIKN